MKGTGTNKVRVNKKFKLSVVCSCCTVAKTILRGSQKMYHRQYIIIMTLCQFLFSNIEYSLPVLIVNKVTLMFVMQENCKIIYQKL